MTAPMTAPMHPSHPSAGAAQRRLPCVVVVLAKAPVPGLAKTRLIPALGADGAAALARWLLDRTLAAALAAQLGPVELCGAPDSAHPAFGAWAAVPAALPGAVPDIPPAVLHAAQGDGDLGARMARVFVRWQPGAASVLLIGTDVPQLDAAVLRAAAQALQTHDAVFVPALDGGYALVGLRQPAPQLFSDMPWSTAAVMQCTRDRLRASGLRHLELPALHDIDTPGDLVHLQGLGWP